MIELQKSNRNVGVSSPYSLCNAVYFWPRCAVFRRPLLAHLHFLFVTGRPSTPARTFFFFVVVATFQIETADCLFLLWIFLAFPSPPPPHTSLFDFSQCPPIPSIAPLIYLPPPQDHIHPPIPLYTPLSFYRALPFCIPPAIMLG